ncbi:capsule biosynthesis protein [Paracoccus sediminicola]|uniref:capsule biosynthesis protein n=1 Tax=Paracoccus sediminicola TaxID=3017783 RepID=UPI0022F04176|nr:capsule biosynthesis protein [Paracoccus sediminicola]WBU55543.1 capsule biosynthesis protein [Paracoccus sediminicola]
MTTPPRVRIYRSKRRDAVLGVQGDAGREAARTAAAAENNAAAGPAPPIDQEQQISAIRAEGLTGRQLRLARRIAAMHGIDVASDEEAVLVLRNRGIDPFHRSSLSKIVANAGTSAADAQIGESEPPRGTGNQLALLREPRLPGATRPLGQITPAQIPADRDALPSREALTEQRRAAEILRIQRDIARRRRIKQFWLAVRLLLLVGIPTAIAGWYYYVVATPLYETRSQFLIQQADTASVGSGNSILSGIQLNPDSVAVQSYLTSKNAMLRLDDEIGFKSAFQDPALDPLLRLPPDATDDDAFKTYSDMLKVGYDPTEGVLDMDVIAPDPALSEEYSRALIRYAEGMVDDMTSRVRSDQMAGAQENYEEAERRVRDAQAEVQALQEQMGVLDPQSESGLVMSRIGQLQGELTSKQLELAQLQANAQPNPSRVQGVEGDIARLRELIAETRSELTEGSDARGSLAQVTGRLRIAEADLETRQALLASAAEQLEIARVEANKQVRYLSLSVAPVAPQNATYPKAFSNTVVAFLIFLAIYLMLSLTASILREQVST